jgi:hypothetical protein
MILKCKITNKDDNLTAETFNFYGLLKILFSIIKDMPYSFEQLTITLYKFLNANICTWARMTSV